MEEQESIRKSASPKHLGYASRGILLALLSGLSISCTTLVVKYLKDIYPGQIAVYRFWAIASFVLPQIVYEQENILGPAPHRASILLMAFANTSGIFLAFFAARNLPLGESSVLTGSYPAFVTIIGKFLLKETFGLLQVTALFTTVGGVVLTAGLYEIVSESENTFTTQNIYGILAALGASAGFTISSILWRKLKKVHYSVLLFSAGMVGIVESTVLTAILGNFSLNHRGLEQGLIIIVGILSYLSFFTVVVALRYAEAGPVTVVKASSDVLFSFMWQLVIFGDTPKVTTIIGAALVCISIALLGLRERLTAFLPEKCFDLF